MSPTEMVSLREYIEEKLENLKTHLGEQILDVRGDIEALKKKTAEIDSRESVRVGRATGHHDIYRIVFGTLQLIVAAGVITSFFVK